MKKDSKLNIVLRGIIAENPVLILILGTCPTLAMTTSVISAFSMGIAATIVLVFSNMIISALRRIIPDSVRIPCYIVIISGLVTAVQLLLQAFLPAIYDMLGVYLALIVVNCIILGRAEMYARKNSVVNSALDGIGMGLGFLAALLIISTIREIIGNGSFAGLTIPIVEKFKIPVFVQAPGGFMVYGIVIAAVNKLTAKKGGIKKKSFSCEGCPSSAACHGSCGTDTSKEKEVAENA